MAMGATILIVDDEEDLLDLLEYTLTKEGYDVIACRDTKRVEAILEEEEISLLLMDRNLQNIEGSEYVMQLRRLGYDLPVIYLSAKERQEEILEGFARGADDYITKPFDLAILKARIKAVLKRASQADAKAMQKEGDILYDPSTKQFFIEGQAVMLTKLEHDLLLVMLRHKQQLLSRAFLLEEVWDDAQNRQLKTVTVAIKRLKEKIDPQGKRGYIKSVRAEGYILLPKGKQ